MGRAASLIMPPHSVTQARLSQRRRREADRAFAAGVRHARARLPSPDKWEMPPWLVEAWRRGFNEGEQDGYFY